MGEIDWNAAGTEVVELLQELIRFDTTNPPGNETPCIEFIARILGSAGYEPTVLESAPGRGNVVARYRGTGEKEPLLIYGHVDVVPAEAHKWTHKPFSGDSDQGCIWGRGTLDMKSMVAHQLLVMLLLSRQKEPLKRDVIFAATADEESGGEWGAGWLVENHPELIRAEYALSEGAGSTIQVGTQRFYGVRTAEKATARFQLIAEGAPGHGSIPRTDTAVHVIAEAVDRLYDTRLPLHMTPTVQRILTIFAGSTGIELSEPIDETLIDDIASRLPIDLGRALQSIVRNTAVPTGLKAGTKINVIPSRAEANVDARILPGQTQQDLAGEVRTVIGDGCTIEFVDSGKAQEVDPGDDLYRTIEAVLHRHESDAKVLPIMLSGATDARWVSNLGSRCLGFSPIAIPAGFSTEGLVHGHDERVPVDGFRWGARVFYEIVREFAAH
jgi:acetylornithine deacetylase/succinyl-diaminopimelate desuccinylase-like protein